MPSILLAPMETAGGRDTDAAQMDGGIVTKRKYPITASEAEEQATLFDWAALHYKKYPELELLYHIPNGGSRNKIEAANLKRQGVKAGVPDLCLPVAKGSYHGLYIELKAHQNTPSEKQSEWISRLSNQGYYACVCWGWAQAADIIQSYMKM